MKYRVELRQRVYEVAYVIVEANDEDEAGRLAAAGDYEVPPTYEYDGDDDDYGLDIGEVAKLKEVGRGVWEIVK